MKRLLAFFKRLGETIFYDDGAVFVVLLFAFFALAFATVGDVLLPVVIAAVLSYVMLGVQGLISRWTPPIASFVVAYTLFLGFMLGVGLWLIPELVAQVVRLAGEVPELTRTMLVTVRSEIEAFDLPGAEQFTSNISLEILDLANEYGRGLAASTPTLAQSILTWLLYYVLVPVMVFFFMKDRDRISIYIYNLLPGDKGLATSIWRQMDGQMANYIRGKALEVAIVTLMAWALFASVGLQFGLLLAIATGLSVIVPVVGAFVVTIPVAVLALLQFGTESTTWILISLYLILQFIDGYVIVPLIFSASMKLHPLVVITSVLFFGGVWGFWGAFLAIPLATLIKLVIENWPGFQHSEDEDEAVPALGAEVDGEPTLEQLEGAD